MLVLQQATYLTTKCLSDSLAVACTKFSAWRRELPQMRRDGPKVVAKDAAAQSAATREARDRRADQPPTKLVGSRAFVNFQEHAGMLAVSSASRAAAQELFFSHLRLEPNCNLSFSMAGATTSSS